MARCLKKPRRDKRKHGGGKKGEGSSSWNSIPSVATKVWQRGIDMLEDGEELQCDPTAYNSLHAFHIGWPCLSFDILHDYLGLIRTQFPHTVYAVAGTQTEKSPNYIGIIKISNISGKRHELVPNSKNEDSDMESDSDDSGENEEVNGSGKPDFQIQNVHHEGCVNRIRAMTQNPNICASWSDCGHVQIWDFSSHLYALEESHGDVSRGASSASNKSHLVKFSGHKDEGYAIDWSPVVPGKLLSGDCINSIHLWDPTSGTWNIDSKPFIGHAGSVEDLQWHPTNPFVFASCSVDKSIAIWDIRKGKSPALSIKAHDSDVNVISWNRLSIDELASGSDDGTFSIWDIKMPKDGSGTAYASAVIGHSQYHKHPITSIEWSPHESTTLALTASDNQLTIWDFSLERDEEEEAEFKANMKEEVIAPSDLPPQLLFVHQGQNDLKELHWHSQIPGMIISTAADGFNILMPSNLE